MQSKRKREKGGEWLCVCVREREINREKVGDGRGERVGDGRERK